LANQEYRTEGILIGSGDDASMRDCVGQRSVGLQEKGFFGESGLASLCWLMLRFVGELSQ
jgi:hypothetical protein